MHPLDVKRNIEWIVHLIGLIMVTGWFAGLIATLAAAALDGNGIELFVVFWPLAVGFWLLLAKAPIPFSCRGTRSHERALQEVRSACRRVWSARLTGSGLAMAAWSL